MKTRGHMRGILREEKEVEMENLFSKMEVFTKDSGKKIKRMEVE